jgi:acyl carrier protein
VGDLRALEELGAEVAYGAVDVAEEGPLASFLADREQSGAPPLRGIIHAASVWRDGRGQALIRSLAQLDLEALGQVLRPKVLGGFLLHRLSAGAPLDFFKLFSSGASVIGSAGQGNYAAANSFLDALAHHRRLTGQVALSVNWGPVSGAGFGATEEGLRVHAQWERNGLHRLTPRELTAALEPLLGSGAPQLAVMKVDWRQLGRLFPDLVRSPWASRVAEAVVEQGRSGFLERLAETPPGDRLELLTEHLQQQIAEVMGVVPEPEQKLFDLGLDSLMAVALRNRLEHSLGAEIRVTAIFNYPTLEALAGYLAREALGLELPAREEAVPAPLPAAHDPDARGSLAWVQELSDDEVERRLTERLARQEVTP